MEIGIKNERYFIIQVDLHEEDGPKEVGNIVKMLIENDCVSDKGKAHLEQCYNYARKVYVQKKMPN